MSGKDEKPVNKLLCPECLRVGITSTVWTLLVGPEHYSNWGRFRIEDERLNMRFLSRKIGKTITIIKCFHRGQFYRTRHTFGNDCEIYWSVVKAAGFEDGVVKRKRL